MRPLAGVQGRRVGASLPEGPLFTAEGLTPLEEVPDVVTQPGTECLKHQPTEDLLYDFPVVSLPAFRRAFHAQHLLSVAGRSAPIG